MSVAPGRYCAPKRCYCGEPSCPAYASYGRPLEPIRETVLDTLAIASGRRRSTLSRYREAQSALAQAREGRNDAAGSKVAQVRSGLDQPGQSPDQSRVPPRV